MPPRLPLPVTVDPVRPGATLPTRGSSGSAGYDAVADIQGRTLQVFRAADARRGASELPAGAWSSDGLVLQPGMVALVRTEELQARSRLITADDPALHGAPVPHVRLARSSGAGLRLVSQDPEPRTEIERPDVTCRLLSPAGPDTAAVWELMHLGEAPLELGWGDQLHGQRVMQAAIRHDPAHPAAPRSVPCEAGVLVLAPGDRAQVPLGFRMRLPADYRVDVQPRSGRSWKEGFDLTNSPGLIDGDYPGEYMALVVNHGFWPLVIRHGERIVQMVFDDYSTVVMLNGPVGVSTERRGGMGSTGR